MAENYMQQPSDNGMHMGLQWLMGTSASGHSQVLVSCTAAGLKRLIT